ncbi:FxLYD domain-containing protein [Rhodanobacter sp. MP7CTX1]|jgi:hypothetical protein|uniref:FxLYD domain-containing protein n=1 Tax=Rhodanobacter sp. MP7CTX1 TaxID=2723084 RepID=UPI00160BE731|nr:FxLYD domain-containing protein [Rhodanobacter sp. MP7CTX1]MBB6188097.1 hypothetical protein [Rhodanobacter sp. MP7CTX1]
MKLRFAVPLLLLVSGLASSAAFAGEPLKHRVRVDSFRVERDITPGRNKVVGTLTNVSRAPVRVAKVRFRLFDATGRGIGLAVDEVHDLEPGQTWKFHARAPGNVSRAHLLSVEAK